MRFLLSQPASRSQHCVSEKRPEKAAPGAGLMRSPGGWRGQGDELVFKRGLIEMHEIQPTHVQTIAAHIDCRDSAEQQWWEI